MSMQLEQDLTFRLGWPLICSVACKAMILGVTFEQFVVLAMRERMNQK